MHDKALRLIIIIVIMLQSALTNWDRYKWINEKMGKLFEQEIQWSFKYNYKNTYVKYKSLTGSSSYKFI